MLDSFSVTEIGHKLKISAMTAAEDNSNTIVSSPKEFIQERMAIHSKVNNFIGEGLREKIIENINEKRLQQETILFEKKLDKRMPFYQQYSPNEKYADQIVVIYIEEAPDPGDTHIEMSGHVILQLRAAGQKHPVIGCLLMPHHPPTCSDEEMTYGATMGKVTFSNKQDYMLVKETSDRFIEILKTLENEEKGD